VLLTSACVQALEYPIPPFPPLDAIDLEDPNWWCLRLEIFRKLREKTPEEKDITRRFIDRQLRELQQHLDYLNALENYADTAQENPRPNPKYEYPVESRK
jgi:hypothetical protein